MQAQALSIDSLGSTLIGRKTLSLILSKHGGHFSSWFVLVLVMRKRDAYS